MASARADPLHDVLSSVLRLRTAGLDAPAWRQVAGGTAAAWLGDRA